MGLRLDRRGLLFGGAAAFGLGLAGAWPAAAQAQRLRFLWWGSQERADRTMRAVEAFRSEMPDLSIVGEFAGWSDYWPRLATQVAGRNAPDVIQMDYRYLFEYARRGALMPLDAHLGKELKIEDFGAPNIDSGRVDGKLYAVNLGVNSSAVIYDAAAWEKAGVEAPKPGTTWEEFAANAAKFGENKPKPGYYATADLGGGEPSFELWLRQNDRQLYAPDGSLGYEAADAAKWFKLWADMRASGACVPADVQALDQLTIETNALTTGKAATTFAHSNQFVGYQKLNKAKLALAPYPLSASGGPSGHYLKPSMQISLSAALERPEAALAFANFLVAQGPGVKALGVERGVPASPAMRDLLTPELNETDQAMVEFIALVTPGVGPIPAPPPAGAGELQFTLKRLNEEVGFERTTPEEAGGKLVAEADAILKRG